jgi:hypothetical protein
MRLSMSACSIRSSIRRRGSECRLSSMGAFDTRLVRGFRPLNAGQTDYSFLP